MNIYIKQVKNSKGQIKEWLWINYTINGKRFRKPLEMENTRANYKKAENEILPLLQYKLMNGELNRVLRIKKGQKKIFRNSLVLRLNPIKI